MAVPIEERSERLNGPVHTWFGLTYANYQVLHRTLMQSMPVGWQERMVACLEELREAYSQLEWPDGYIVLPGREHEYGSLSRAARHLVEHLETDGQDRERWERVLVPMGDDPVPHYNRGRTFVEPRQDDEL